MRIAGAELLKLLGLPSAWIAFVIGLVVSPAIAFLNASTAVRAIENGTGAVPGGDAGYQELAFGVLGAIILGVVAISSEYLTEGEESAGTRQVTTSLTAVPSRTRLLAAKTTALVLTVAVLATVTTAVTLTVTRVVLGDHATSLTADTAPRALGVVLYWVLTSLLAYGITLLTRNGVIPLTVLILNTSLVSVTYLLSRVIDAANYLPDLVGARMFLRDFRSSVQIAPAIGGLVMTSWVIAVLAVGVAVFRRRDA
ncbi:ABC transporter permease [Streptosporangium sp. NPDC049304]|uniref:ABC transporter permease n=1 Tax=Streptosporangium sp. NPDC049304 TaxID=3154830 RepID=UPI003435EFE2